MPKQPPSAVVEPTQEFANVLESAQTLSPAERSLAPTGQVKQWIEALGQKHGVDAKLLESVVATESGFNPDAISGAGAQGLMQLMPSTAQSLGVKDPLDPLQNLDGGTRYLKGLLTKYQSVPKALAAYNAGPGAVDRAGGIPPYAETQHYVDKVMTRYQKSLVSKCSTNLERNRQSPLISPFWGAPVGAERDNDDSWIVQRRQRHYRQPNGK